MKVLIGILATLCVAQLAYADVDTGSQTLDEILNKSGEGIDALHKSFLDFAGVKSDAELKRKVEDTFSNFGTTLSDQLKALKEETKSQTGKAAGYYRDFQDKINKDIEQFKSDHPDFTNNAEKFQEAVERRYRLVADEARVLKEKIKADGGKLSDKTQKLLNDIVEGSSNSASSLKQQLEEAGKSPIVWTSVMAPVMIIISIYVLRSLFFQKKKDPEKVQ